MAKEEIPEESIIYIDDDSEPSSMAKMEAQVDRLLMPPPVDNTLIAVGTLIALSQRPPEYIKADSPQHCSPEKKKNGAVGKKLQDREESKKAPQTENTDCGQNAYRTKRCRSLTGVSQTGWRCGPFTMASS